jgi:hypothetical protein
MNKAIAELEAFMGQDDKSKWVTHYWETHNLDRQEKIDQWKELRDYLFATDTTTTTNSHLPWKNTTTLPKLCQLRDNLHANYRAALFPNDNWLIWEGYTQTDSILEKRDAIQAYMANKLRQSRFMTRVDEMLLDYIDYGNAFAYAGFEQTYKELPNGEQVPDYIGPTAGRISPLDIVFDPTASSFKDTYKVVRSVKSLGEIKKLAEELPEGNYWEDALRHREEIARLAGSYSPEDFDKAVGYQADGFGSMHSYYTGNKMEILEFYGDWYNPETGELFENYVITVVDRNYTARAEIGPEWYAGGPIVHAGWRGRPDNLWGMGPLDNLVGLQYRLDHLENLKADAMDLMVHPPLKIIGEVEQFKWGPGAEIQIDEGGSDVQELGLGLGNVLATNQELALIEQRMELYAGAPREAMGIRTPGEKTAFEVQQLDNASSRIFQTKINQFEQELLEPLLNMMLEAAQRNMNGTDVIRVMDESVGAEIFSEITVGDITANGLLRPVGARHFAQKANALQNLTQIFSSPLAAKLDAHTSGMEMTRFINDVLQIHGYDIFSENVAVLEQQRTQQEIGLAQETLSTQASMEL